MTSLTAVARAYLKAIESGEPMKARIAVFLDFVDARIHRQRNYDCFDPF